MVNLFSGWRTRFGLSTLIIALIFMCGWVRSFFYTEGFAIPSRTAAASLSVWSNQDGLCWIKELCSENPEHFKDNQSFQWGSRRHSGRSLLDEFGTTRTKWLGFEVFDVSYRHLNLRSDPSGDRVQLIAWVIPYWSLILPLSVVSAYLLLTTPRTLPQLKTPDPNPVECM